MECIRLTVDLDRVEPIYQQLRQQVKRLVAGGRCRPGRRLPTVRQLALDLEINGNELSRICRQLAADGYLLRRHGTGTYAIYLKEGAGSASQRETVFDI